MRNGAPARLVADNADPTSGTITFDRPLVAGDRITVTAKADGAAAGAAGAAGNDWSITFDVASTWVANPAAAVDIDVRVNSRDTAVFDRFNTGDAKFGDLKAALEGNSAFDAMFEVKLPANATTATSPSATNNTSPKSPLDT